MGLNRDNGKENGNYHLGFRVRREKGNRLYGQYIGSIFLFPY